MQRRHLNTLRKELTGNYKLIAHRAGVTKTFVSYVLKGERISQKVIDAAFEIRDELRRERQEIEQKNIKRIQA